MATRERLEQALMNAHAAGDTQAAKAFADAIRNGQYDDEQETQIEPTAQPEQQEEVGVLDALGSGFIRGVEQVTGGTVQRVAEFRKNQLNAAIDELAGKMQSGELPASPENLAALDKLQTEAVKITRDLRGAEGVETSKREEYSPIQEQRPIASTIGNIGGQIAGLLIPGMQGRLPAQMAKGALEGALAGYVQPTVGDESEMQAAALGGGIGGLAPAALRPITNAAGGIYRAATGAPTGDAADVIEYAGRQNLPLMTTDVAPPDTFVGRGAQALGEKIPITGTGAPRAEQQAARVAEIKRLSEQYGAPVDEEIVASLRNKSNTIANAAGKRYQNIVEQMGVDEIPVANTMRAIDAEIERQTRPGALQNPALLNSLNEVKERLLSGPQDLSLLRQNRTFVRENLKSDGVVNKDSESRAIDSIYRAMTTDMTDGVAEKLGDDTAKSMRQADAVWAREANEVKKTKLKNILNKGDVKPEEASKMLFSNDMSEIKTLFSALDTTGRQNARAAIIQRAYDKSDGSPEKFYSEMRRLKNQADVFFRGDQGKSLNGLIKYLDYTREAGQAAVRTKSGQEVLQYGIPVAAMADISSTGGVGTAAFGGYGLLAQAYESEPVRNIMVRMNSVEKGSTQFEKLAAELESILNQSAARAPQAIEDQ